MAFLVRVGVIAVLSWAWGCGNGDLGEATFEFRTLEPGTDPTTVEVDTWAHRGEAEGRFESGGLRYYSEFPVGKERLGQLDIDLPGADDDARPRLRYREEGGAQPAFDGSAQQAALVLAIDHEMCACLDLRFDARFVDPGADGEFGTADDRAREFIGARLRFDESCSLPRPARDEAGIVLDHVNTCGGIFPLVGNVRQSAPAPPAPAHHHDEPADILVVVNFGGPGPPPPPAEPAAGCEPEDGDDSSGCEPEDGGSDDSGESSGCEPDDSGESSSGCEPDEDVGESSESSGGCESDDSGSGGCEGDTVSRQVPQARYACIAPPRRRSIWLGPLQNYLMIGLAGLWQLRRRRQL